MKIECPRCQKILPEDAYDPERTTILCPYCDHTFYFTESRDIKSQEQQIALHPPDGIRVRKSKGMFVLSATIQVTSLPRLFLAFSVLALMTFGALTAEISGGGLEELSPWLARVILMLFIITIGIYLLFYFFGTYELTIQRDRATLKRKIGFLNYSKSFRWSDIAVVTEEWKYAGNNSRNELQHLIVLQGNTVIRFGASLSDTQQAYIISILRTLLAERKESH